jgi:tripartite-type tricarboxylate transporter receptor subunit TctC
MTTMSSSRRSVLRRVLWVGLCGVLALPANPAAARDMEQYFKGKTINIIVGSAAGGGADLNARLHAQYAAKYHPGKPTFVVQNIPGAGQLKGLQTGMRAKPDGLTAASLNTRWAIRSILGEDLAPYDIKTARVVGAPIAVARTELICADRKTHGTWKDILAAGKSVTIGTNEKGGRADIGAALIEMTGGPIKFVYGYGGVAESTAAFDRGELTGVAVCGEDTVPRLYPDWLTSKRLSPLFWWGIPPKDEYIAKFGAPEKPVNLFDLPGVKFPNESKAVMQLGQDMHKFTRALVMSPETPDDLYQTWVEVFGKVMKDPEFVAAATKAGLEVGHGTAEDFQESVKIAGKLTPEGLDLFKKLMDD